MGLFDGAAFFDLGDPEHPVHLGTLPSAYGASFWADVTVHADQASTREIRLSVIAAIQEHQFDPVSTARACSQPRAPGLRDKTRESGHQKTPGSRGAVSSPSGEASPSVFARFG